MKKLLLFSLFISSSLFAQVGINTTTPNAMLEVVPSSATTPSNTDGVIVSRINAFPATNPTVSQQGMLVYLTTTVGTKLPGFYYWNNPTLTWIRIADTVNNDGWQVDGNTVVDTTSFVGTRNNVDLILKRNNFRAGRVGTTNTSYGLFALNPNLNEQTLPYVAGLYNTAFGTYALNNNFEGRNNTAAGYGALYSNINGASNVANGYLSLYSNINGSNNTANGGGALYSNTTGDGNTANGYSSLQSNETGYSNTASGTFSLLFNTSGFGNMAIGYETLMYNTLGIINTASGQNALYNNTTGSFNTAAGASSLVGNKTGDYNTANGYQSLLLNTTGGKNTASGYQSLYSNTTGSNNTGIGHDAQVPDGTANNQVRIGNTEITYAGVQVAWTITSDEKWKENIATSDLGLNFINALRPVSYVRKNDENKTTEYGFIAQELEKTLAEFEVLNAGIINKDDQGMLSVRYNDLLAPMVKAIQELKAENEQLKAENKGATSEIETIKSTNASLANRLEKLEQLLTSTAELK